MPDVYMHNRFAKDLFEKLDLPLDVSLVKIGSQGPDCLYYNVMSNKKQKTRHLGDIMHSESINLLMATAVNSVKKHYSDALFSYLVGFIAHHTLDSTLHPYVYHHVGLYDKNDPKTASMRGLHMRFERRIDACLIAIDTQKAAHKYDYRDALPLKTLPEAVRAFYDRVVHETYDYAGAGELFLTSYKKMRTIFKHALKDRTGLKKVLFSALDLLPSNRDRFLKDMPLPKKYHDFDYLNRAHNTWHHPVTNVPSHKSVEDLYREALEKTVKIIHGIHAYIKNNTPFDFHAHFNNRSMHTGLDCEDDRPMRHFDLFTQNTASTL